MRSLRKDPEPEILTKKKAEWTGKYLEAVRNGTKPASPWSHEQMRVALQAETNSRCAYCDAHIVAVSTPHIEHYRPRHSYPELVVEWDNLTVACPRCNSQKSDIFDEVHPFINPFTDAPADHLVFHGDLIFAPQSIRGQVTITKLGLNHDDVLRARQRRLKSITSLAYSWYAAPVVIKSEILDEVKRDLAEGEYYESAYALTKALGLPVDRISNVRTQAS